MAQDLIAERRIEFTKDGVLTCGFVWYEMWPKVDRRQRRKYVGAIIAFVVGVLVAIFKPPIGGAICVAAIAAWILIRQLGPKATDMVNGLRFRSDGRIEVIDMESDVKRGDGFAGARWASLVRTVDELMNMSLQPMRNRAGGQYRHGAVQGSGGYPTYAIVLDFSTGERWQGASLLGEDAARIILTQLQQALEKVRVRRDELVE